jgi:mRNA-degrading endonuclease RelE of RelBE toxin-antitoxin system
MRSFTTRRFREAYRALPESVREQTRKAYRLFRHNPSHPGLNFKKIDEDNNIYSARVGLRYRVLGKLDGQDIVWFWIGAHSDYDHHI